MPDKSTSFFDNFFLSGHTFNKNEVLLKFKVKVLNTILLVMAFFTFMFAVLSSLGLNPIGQIQTFVNYLLVVAAVILIIRLRYSKKLYTQTAYLLYTSAYIDFLSALIFVDNDEFRIIWFYLLVFASYITGGIRAGNIFSIISIVTVLSASYFIELHLSQTAIISSVLGLIIASLFIRSYTKKIIDFEQELTENKELMITQSRFAAMGEMMSMIAHQWRQPLSTITLTISQEKIKYMLESKESDEYIKVLDKISDTMIYLSDTVEDFQTYFKPEKTSKKVTTTQIINRVKQLLETRFFLEKINININSFKNQEIYTYESELIQVLINIINNAVDVLVERDISNKNIWIKIDYDEKNVSIQIEDNGGGIDDSIIHKIFEPYFSQKSKSGTGLGLYMSKMIIEKHIEGNISVANSSRGACFSISIPKKLTPLSS
ncbi:HAMP domain-containing histidine kinase [Sulfurimonas sp.]|nr:HAMP domain-containing histidine kinase [Sulfurimonas sp.]